MHQKLECSALGSPFIMPILNGSLKYTIQQQCNYNALCLIHLSTIIK